MKRKIAELEGVELDAAVAKADGIPFEIVKDPQGSFVVTLVGPRADLYRLSPSTRWEQGGPIIDRERIAILPYAHQDEYLYDEAGNNPRLVAPPRWWARAMEADTGGWIEVCPEGSTDRIAAAGPTPLIAAMRAFVLLKIGEEIELP